MFNKTICANCGRLVNLAPNICVLCGSNLDESPRVIFVNPAKRNDYTSDPQTEVFFRKAA